MSERGASLCLKRGIQTCGHEVTGLKTYRGPKRKEQLGGCSLSGYYAPPERFQAKHALGPDPGADTGSHSNQVYADCADLPVVENASKQKDRAPFRLNRNGWRHFPHICFCPVS